MKVAAKQGKFMGRLVLWAKVQMMGHKSKMVECLLLDYEAWMAHNYGGKAHNFPEARD